MYKVGDKLMCKIDFNMRIHMKIFKDHEYYILFIENFGLSEDSELLIGTEMVDDFSLLLSSAWIYESNLHHYFYTEKEIRKKKLEKLKEYDY